MPAEPGRAEAHPQGGLPSHRGVRRDRRGGRRRRRAARCARGSSSTRSASPARWRAASSSISPRAPGPSACMPAGRRSRAARGAARPRRLHRAAHRVRGHARPVPRLRPYDARATTTRSLDDFGRALGDADARVQALPVRDHDASLHRLRAPARRARHQGRRHRGDDLRGRRGHRAPAVGAARRRSRRPSNGYAAKFSTPYCIAAGFVRGNVGLDAFTDAAVEDAAVLALAGKVRYVDRSGQSLSEQFHRPYPRAC